LKKARIPFYQGDEYAGKQTLVVYSSGQEVLICTYKNEKKMLRLWFVEGGRDFDDYFREVSADIAVAVAGSSMVLAGNRIMSVLV
jgi:hypothetical protein